MIGRAVDRLARWMRSKRGVEIDGDRLDRLVGIEDPTPNQIDEVRNKPVVRGIDRFEYWALVAFHSHLRRQEWVRDIVESKLRGKGAELAGMGAFGHPKDLPQSGPVPEMDDWEYYFHGCGCCLTHSDGTAIDVDFDGEGLADRIDPYFYKRFLETTTNPTWCERQLRQPEALANAWMFDLDALKDLDLITGRHQFRLSDQGRAIAEKLSRVADILNDPETPSRRCCLLLLAVGDMIGARLDPAGLSDDVIAEIDASAKRDIEHRARRVRRSINANKRSSEALAAFAVLGRDQAETLIRSRVMSVPAQYSGNTAFEILELWDGPGMVEFTAKAFAIHTKLANCVGPLGEYHSDDEPRKAMVVSLCRYLLGSKQRQVASRIPVEVLQRTLAPNYQMNDAEASFLLYLIDPEAGLEKLERGLARQLPINNSQSAAYLALIGNREATQILIRAANGDREEGGFQAACALSIMSSEETQIAANAWLRRNEDYENPVGEEIEVNGTTHRTWSFDEVLRSNEREMIKLYFDEYEKDCRRLIAEWAD